MGRNIRGERGGGRGRREGGGGGGGGVGIHSGWSVCIWGYRVSCLFKRG